MGAHSASIEALLIVGTAQLNEGESRIKRRLENQGYRIEIREDREFEGVLNQNQQGLLDQAAVIIISSSVSARRIDRTFRDTPVPIVVAESALFEHLGMTGGVEGRDFGLAYDQTEVIIGLHQSHPIAAGFVDKVRVCGAEAPLAWGKPRSSNCQIAALPDYKDRAAVFAYEHGDQMFGLAAPARRVGIFLTHQLATQMADKDPGWEIFDEAVNWAVGEAPKQLAGVLCREWKEIRLRRRKQGYDSSSDVAPSSPPPDLVGLALSGGGNRSATFSLGLLQGLQDLKLLRIFDYVSTVSGGGYIGGWWSAWLSRDDPSNGKSKQNSTSPPKDESNRGIFPPPENIVSERQLYVYERSQSQPHVNEEVAPDVLSAGRDPVHYLRLFSNFLTPRKGALSADTWRAITFISRNLILTWLILIPIVIATVLLGQLYFILQPYNPQYSIMYDFLLAGPSREVLLSRMAIASWPLLGLLGWMAALTIAWLYNSAGVESTDEANQRWWESRQWWASPLGIVATLLVIGLLGWFAYSLHEPDGEGIWQSVSDQYQWSWMLKVFGGVWVIGLLFLLVYACHVPRSNGHASEDAGWSAKLQSWLSNGATLPGDSPKLSWQRKRRIRRGQITRLHGVLLVTFVVLAVILAFAGFGHELVVYVHDPPHDSTLAWWLAKSGGWGALIASIAGALFTAVKGSPAGGSDSRSFAKPSLASRLIFAMTPPLVLVVLVALVAWATRSLLSYVLLVLYSALDDDQHPFWQAISALRAATCVGISLSFYFAMVETKWRKSWIFHALCVPLTLISLSAMLAIPLQFWPAAGTWLESTADRLGPDRLIIGGAVLVLCAGILLLLRLAGNEKRKLSLRFWPITLAVLLTLAVGWLAWKARQMQSGCFDYPRCLDDRLYGWLVIFIIGGLMFSMVFAFIELVLGMGDNRRGLWLLTAILLALAALLVILICSALTFWDPEQRLRVVLARVIFGLVGTALSWVVALGWMANPNALSIHSFYKERLVCAFLGASNLRRGRTAKLVTEAVPGDDLLLKDLGNCKRGAPYHLINTTLNLVGGHDLTTAQRSAALFLLSKHFCGSSRTGYRDTREYMDGQLTLGAAVAISGAAASPNMGARTPPAALAMLMTLLNVRLGYWAPTPNKNHWRSPQARLWPFYTLREFLSQTSDLSSYCYLTDGAHFDNTGLYSLVERGCRYIVVADCGADPKPSFEDLGHAIRRCRIDFGAEIDLDISPLNIRNKDGEVRGQARHFVVGTITYAESHVKALNWPESDKNSRTGVIVMFKPAVLDVETADVRQYRLEDPSFPQQSTADQWYDESQFESYRRLGQFCADQAFNRKKSADQTIEGKLDCAIGQLRNEGPFGRQTVKDIFEELQKRETPKQGALTAASGSPN